MLTHGSINYVDLFEYEAFDADKSSDDPLANPSGTLTESSQVNATHLSELTSMLNKVNVFGLSEKDKKMFLALVDSVIKIRDNNRSLDENGSKYLLCMRVAVVQHSLPQLPYRDISWAVNSNSKDTLLDICLRVFPHSLTWADARLFGMGFWIDKTSVLVSQNCEFNLQF